MKKRTKKPEIPVKTTTCCKRLINLIKITSLTGSPLPICHGMVDMKKSYYWSHASDPITGIFNDNYMINTGYDLFSANQIAHSKQSS